MNSDMRLLACPACDCSRLVTQFVLQGYPVQQCDGCRLLFLNPQPTQEVLSKIYAADYFLGGSDPDATLEVSRIKRRTAHLYLDQIVQYGGAATGALLEVGCGRGEFLVEAAHRGYSVRGVELSPHAARAANESLQKDAVTCGTLEESGLATATFDVCVCTDVIEHVHNPLEFMNQVHRVLKPGGVLFLVTPTVDSRLARWLGRRWFEFKVEHLHYFSRSTILNVFARAGFREVELSVNRKVVTLEYVRRHFARFRVAGVSPALEFASRALPRRLREYPVRLQASGVTVIGRAAPARRQPMVSVIVPAYNEGRTIRGALDRLIAKPLDGLDKEIIIVEGNSTDGTREAVLEYRDVPGVKLVLSERPRGKGHAVRQGLEQAAGDFVLIQDADDEYDINDYDALLEPLRQFRRAFVMGSRHQGHWRIRSFGGPVSLSAWMNFGHILLTEFFNLLYGQSLSDPWTMYKVFRRDCIYRMSFECNRFDFDVELVAKLVRRGFTPQEIPVRYQSRSFDQGKKVRVFRDPWTWLWACVKYRVVSVDRAE